MPVPIATSSDLRVIVDVDPIAYQTAKEPRRVAIVAYVINVSKRAVSVYLPGLVESDNRAEVVRESGVPFEYDLCMDHGGKSFVRTRSGGTGWKNVFQTRIPR